MPRILLARAERQLNDGRRLGRDRLTAAAAAEHVTAQQRDHEQEIAYADGHARPTRYFRIGRDVTFDETADEEQQGYHRQHSHTVARGQPEGFAARQRAGPDQRLAEIGTRRARDADAG